ncbi:MAG: class III poly(R)-hydroxyalkanoic acid synthase subunit PhaE, partial [Pseudomonadota bacterium]|nr:class III poly(R)-hydroxyalkanoic acid synthase subunit PhaE [Pseudomonadota bacterium]
MANQGFGGGDFESLARQYWNTWGETMRQAATAGQPAAQPAVPGWNEAASWWSQLARGGQPAADDAVQRFNTQAQGWFGQMQQLAAQFAGRNASASDVAGEWRRMLGGAGGNPFAEMFGAMPGRGQHGPEQWVQQAAPYLEMLQRPGGQWLDAPAFGFAREHQERLQALAKAQMDYQQRSQAYQALMGEAGQAAFGHFERKLAERGTPGRELQSGRALFDLWIDAAEEAYAEIALSPRFREVYGEYVNAQMRLRGAVQKEVEQACGALGIPTRTEIDSTHRKVVQLERELRRLRDAVAEPEAARSRGSARQGPRRAAADDAGGKRDAEPVTPARKRPSRTAAKPATRAASRSSAW